MARASKLQRHFVLAPSAGARLVQAAFGVGLSCSLLGGAATASAQTSAQTSTADEGQNITITSTTARKRNELAQDVPITMDIIGGKDIKDSGITRVKDIQSTVPGLVIETRESSGKIALRGVGTGDVGLGTDQSVAVHVDGVYQAHGATGLARMFDVDRVEVLRGPQGTLYGRNATAGVINLVSKAPQMKFAAEADVSVGNFGLRQIQGMINVPVADGTAFRLAMINSESDGRIKNLYDNSKVRDDDSFKGVRASLRSRMDTVGLDFSLQYINDTSAGALIPHPERDDDRLGNTARASYDLAYFEGGAPTQKKESLAVSLKLTKDFGNVRLTSITGYGDYKGGLMQTLSRPNMGPGTAISLRINEPADQWSQELQLSGGDEKKDWVTGVYYLKFSGVDQRQVSRYKIGLIPFDTNASAGGEATAIFGDVNWRLTPSVRLNAGLRHTWDKKEGVAASKSNLPAPIFVIDPPQTASNSWGATTGRIGLDWKMNKSTMVFGSVSTGYKSGGVVPNYEAAKPFDVYKPEKLTALEVGQKTTFAGDAGLFNLSAFNYDYRDKVEIYGPTPTTFGFYNAPKARVSGIDGYLNLKLAKHLRWDLNLAYLDATFKDFPAIDDMTGEPMNYAGNRLGRAPKFSATMGLTLQRLPVAGIGQGEVRLEYAYRSQIFFDFKNDPIWSAPAIGFVNLSARVDSNDGRWYAYLAGRNLTDKRWIEGVSLTPTGYWAVVNQARSVHIGAGYRF